MTLFLDAELKVRWFTPPIAELFPVILGDVGRRITDLVPYFNDRNFRKEVLAVIGGSGPCEAEVRTEAKRWFLRRILPHVTVADTGVAVTFTDITERKRAEDALRANEARFRACAVAGSYAVYRTSPDWQERYQLEAQNFLTNTEANQGWATDYILPEDMPRVSAAIQRAIAG